MGCALSVLCLVGLHSNGLSARHDAYDAALRYVRASAATTAQLLEHSNDQLRLTSDALRSAVELSGPDALQSYVDTNTQALQNDVAFVVTSSTGKVVAASAVLELGKADFETVSRQLSQYRPGVSASGPQEPIEFNGRAWLPVFESFEQGRNHYGLLFLVDTQVIASAWRQGLAGESGWLQVFDNRGSLLLEIADVPTSENSLEFVQDTAAGMTERSLWGGKRWVSGAAKSRNGLTVRSSISEVSALKEFHRRYRGVVAIVAGVVVLVMVLAAGTARALRKFDKKEQYLRTLATVDILTGLPNRRNFHTLLARASERALRSHEPFGLLFIDLDNFKYINDSLGHDAGDRLLRKAAQVLRSVIGANGEVCRLGGDEFTVLLPGVASAVQAQRIADRVVAALRAPLSIDGLEMQTRVSAGVALMPEHAQTASDLMRFADLALYEAKRSGKDCAVVYERALATKELSQAALVRALELAIGQDQLVLAYQPKFQLDNGALSGFEALVRWQHPQRGLVLPGEFIGLAEKTGLIADLGNWVLKRAVRQMREWHDQGFGWQRVAVNVSPLQLRNDGFVAFVRNALAQHEVPGHYLQLELTEGSLAANPAKAQSLVRDLRGLGVAVAVDDFGTGYSSLGALQGFELDCLKIDRSFVLALNVTRGLEICRAVVSFGHALGLRVIAEGVETVAQRDVLATFGCDEVQGFLYSRPLAPEDAIVRALAYGHSASTDQLREFETGEVASPSAPATSRESASASAPRALPVR